jgi:hypothetical protein
MRNYFAHIRDRNTSQEQWWRVLTHHPYDDAAAWEDPCEYVLRHPATGWFFPALWRAVYTAAAAGLPGAEAEAHTIHAGVELRLPAYAVTSPTPKASPSPAAGGAELEGEGAEGGADLEEESADGAGAAPVLPVAPPPPAAAEAAAAAPAAACEEEDDSPPPPPPLHAHPDFKKWQKEKDKARACACQ